MSKMKIGWAEEEFVLSKPVSLVGQFAERISEYVEKLSHPRKNRHKKALKNGMNRSISLIYLNRSHLFHGSLVGEPLPVWVLALRQTA